MVKITSERIYVAIPCHNRGRILAKCVPTVKEGMLSRDMLVLFNDGSTEYTDDSLSSLSDFVYGIPNQVGIEIQRTMHFHEYWKVSNTFDYLYLTDSDALHDPGWRTMALGLFHEHGRHPVCLYNTKAHADLVGNLIEDLPEENVVWRKYAPGISWLLHRDHVQAIMEYRGYIRAWDWNCCDILGRRMAISKESYVDHIGLGGLHHPEDEGLEGGDRAIRPTPWLVAKRAEVIKELSQ
jgi:glycosyltransferase involved in cell wall biosynthesis